MMRRFLLLITAIALVAGAAACSGPTERETLNARHLDTPRFDPLEGRQRRVVNEIIA